MLPLTVVMGHLDSLLVDLLIETWFIGGKNKHENDDNDDEEEEAKEGEPPAIDAVVNTASTTGRKTRSSSAASRDLNLENVLNGKSKDTTFYQAIS